MSDNNQIDGEVSSGRATGPGVGTGKAIDPNLAHLEARDFRNSHFSWDLDSVESSTEKFGNRALLLAFGGVGADLVIRLVLVSGLGMAGTGVAMLFNGISWVCLGVAAIIAVALIGAGVWSAMKKRSGAKDMILAGLWPLIVVGGYEALILLVAR